eukprot:gnl/TRDRNA2_/TRDRNA2_173677_c15_seq1.p1 gnl/TRDRNA2_/TRDRNA2_173677_c15~~gnl/TRDRNA2_/TRDRNA2_173677_c15_seq1.p1  ORF type:complete len:162 (+),score=13.06 gnl/TRDRNA2_/TRDRNA2_173677_c15_seq1:256-741(+)
MLSVKLMEALTRSLQRRILDLNCKNALMSLWALARHASLQDTWRFLDHAKLKVTDALFGPLCPGAVLMECEQRSLLLHEVQLLMGFDARRNSVDLDMCMGAATIHVAAMCTAATGFPTLRDAQECTRIKRGASSNEIACIWCSCDRKRFLNPVSPCRSVQS